MKQQPQSNPRDSHDSSPNQAVQSYQTQQFQIQSGTITHQQITRMIEKWDIFMMIKQKFGTWSLNFPYQKLLKIAPQQFYKTAIHYVFLRKLSILIKDFDQTQMLKKSMQLKEIYKIMLLKGRLKGRRFDNLLLVTVKLIGFFFASHTNELIITKELQSQMYAILVFVLLGTEVGQRAYLVLMQKYKKKPLLKLNRCSQIQKLVTPVYEGRKVRGQNRRKGTKLTTYSRKRLMRTVCRAGTQILCETVNEVVDQQLQEMKQLLKNNLSVKEFIPQPKPKQTLQELIAKKTQITKKLSQLKEVNSMQKKQMKQKKIFYTQMSSSLDIKRDCESLNMLKNHSLKIRPQKESRFYQVLKKEDIVNEKKQKVDQLKLPVIQKIKQPQTISYQAMMLKKKQPNYWKKVVSGMKENHFEHIQNFPPITAKIYFNSGDQNENNKNKKSIDENLGDPSQSPTKDQNFHGEYITEKVDTQRNPPAQLKLLKTSSVSSMQKKPSFRENNILKETKQHINIVEYSRVSNESQIYKSDQGFINVYSNHPLNDQKSRLKRKSYNQLKEMERRFYQDCKLRHQQIKKCYLS